ncbi:MAG: DUF1852 domain-containing protein [Kangiellaceae bacterium]|uniref:DUF1852 domain-containing protein n=1 Tax=Celeribacter sp. HF31 TaxID=2721558 RepID=UPI0014302319|nr:DUF1852 domain-containing protein [Celeribacter sp. HF31]NIY79868.1 DUF1852 domain-containing protein [Celeribacter sp. HF31]NVK23268.1 DUF1852 domain-containing protein [Kangiellaceae bacterium]
MPETFTFEIKSLRFDETYMPADSTRLTTNFANLARGAYRQQNLANALRMIDNRFNDLAQWDNPEGDRYAVELDIISVEMDVVESGTAFPAIEMLNTTIVDKQSGTRVDGLVGNNFSSYLRDYDFSVVLPAHNKARDGFSLPEDFGDLHGKIFQAFVASDTFKTHFRKPPVICLSVSETKTYRRTANAHPVLGLEYAPSGASLTEQYFDKMGMKVRYFMPPKSVAPLAFYVFGDLLNDYSNLELIGTISTMEAFQKIYRPEIYNANSVAGQFYRPSLKHEDFSPTRVIYDREERARLAAEQGRFAEEHFIKPYGARLAEWSAQFSQTGQSTQSAA